MNDIIKNKIINYCDNFLHTETFKKCLFIKSKDTHTLIRMFNKKFVNLHEIFDVNFIFYHDTTGFILIENNDNILTSASRRINYEEIRGYRDMITMSPVNEYFDFNINIQEELTSKYVDYYTTFIKEKPLWEYLIEDDE